LILRHICPLGERQILFTFFGAFCPYFTDSFFDFSGLFSFLLHRKGGVFFGGKSAKDFLMVLPLSGV